MVSSKALPLLSVKATHDVHMALLNGTPHGCVRLLLQGRRGAGNLRLAKRRRVEARRLGINCGEASVIVMLSKLNIAIYMRKRVLDSWSSHD